MRWGPGPRGDLPPSASSHHTSDGFSPKRRGAAEGPGAELSICYQKVSGYVGGGGGEVSRDTAGGSRCQGLAGAGGTDRAKNPLLLFWKLPLSFPACREFCRDEQVTTGLMCGQGGDLI